MNIKMSPILLTPLLILSNPLAALAEDKAVTLDLSGHIKMYMNYADQDGSARKTDILRDTDITFSGETTLSNGLTVGANVNTDGDGGDGFEIEDSFIYASGDWGRLSAGAEDGTAFLLQVAAPSADENVDGIETFVNPINFNATGLSGTDFETDTSEFGLDYDNDLTAGADKISYISPVFSGFQAGASYTPDVSNFSPASRSLNGNNTDNVLDEFGDAWELGARFENSMSDTINYTVGAGYTSVNTERTNGASTIDTFTEWNTGFDMNIGDYGIGVVYTENNGGKINGNDSKTWVIGADYTVGDIKYGASWLNNTHEETTTTEIDTNRFTGGLVYEYGPGLSFRGSVSHTNANAPASLGGDVKGTAITVGTQILF